MAYQPASGWILNLIAVMFVGNIREDALNQRAQVEPLAGRALEAAVAEVISVYIDACTQRVASHGNT